MKITEVRIYSPKSKRNDNYVGSATVTLDNLLVIHDIEIYQENEEIYISFPDKRKPSGKYADIVHPISQEARELFKAAIIENLDEKDNLSYA